MSNIASLAEREIITVGLGNYSTLIAAQWANGTTKFDIDQSTLYMECRGAVGGGELSNDGKVPRLVLLDNHHSTRIKRIDIPLCDTPAGDNDVGAAHNDDKDDEENEEFDEFSYIPTSATWQTYHDARHHQPQRDHEKSSSSSSSSSDEHDDDSDRRGRGQDKKHHNAVAKKTKKDTHRDPSASSPSALDDDQKAQRDERLRQRDQTNAKAIFDIKDHFIPWHQYIKTGLHARSLNVLSGVHSEVRGASLLHSVGFGLSQLKPSTQDDVDATFDAIRYMLEASDHPQGVNTYVDADTCFAGAAVNLSNEIVESYGSKLSRFTVGAYEPFPLLDPAQDPFYQIRKDELALNRALSLHHLSASSSLFTPLFVDDWSTMASQVGAHHVAPSDDAAATAQLIATTWDTSMYGMRVGSGPEDSHPSWYMSDMERVCRPCNGMRVASVFSAVPLRVRMVGEEEDPCFWTMLNRNPLLPRVRASAAEAAELLSERSTVGADRNSFVPLTHSVTTAPESDAGRVLGHAVSLRGVKHLEDKKYPRDEALLRYVLPLRSSTFHTTVIKESCPISDTFPSSVLFPSSASSAGATTAAAMGLTSLHTASHVCATYSAAPMLNDIVQKYDAVWRYRKHLHRESYAMEDDDWKEVSEELHELHDDYRHSDEDGYGCGNDDDE